MLKESHAIEQNFLIANEQDDQSLKTVLMDGHDATPYFFYN